MMKIGMPLLVLVVAVSGEVGAQTAPTTTSCTSVAGVWVNQLNSTMIISSVDSVTHQVTGCFCSPSGTQNEWFPLTGWINSQPPISGQDNVQLVSWAVNWGATYGSITAWSGICVEENSGSLIRGQWNLTKANASQRWAHRLTDTDTFTPATTPTCSNVPSSCWPQADGGAP